MDGVVRDPGFIVGYGESFGDLVELVDVAGRVVDDEQQRATWFDSNRETHRRMVELALEDYERYRRTVSLGAARAAALTGPISHRLLQ